jgi:hypothetical protein
VRLRTITTAFALALIARPAFANDPAAAQALFDQAQALMRQERWSEACPKLEESQRLDPGDGTVLHLAACREHEGKIATAWGLYEDALVAAKRSSNKGRARIAQERIDFLAPRLHRLRLKVASGDKKLTSFKIVRDDTPIGTALWNDPFPVDPGSHTITASADGYKKWSKSIDIPTSNGETTVEVPLLEAEPIAPTKPKEPKRLTIEEATRGDSQRTVGLALGGIGVAGLVAGAVFGAFAFSKQSEADSNCKAPDFTMCNPRGVDAGKSGETFGTISTIAFIAGGALAAGGAVLYLTAPEHGRVGLAIAPSSVSLGGRW